MGRLWDVGSGPVARGIEEEDCCPRIFTDWHGLLDGGLPGVVLCFSAIEVSGYPAI